VPRVSIPGQGTHNVIYVATENDSVYAFDAAGNPSTPLWQQSFISPSTGVTTVPCTDVALCSAISPIAGITATPVIDPTTDTLYVVAFTKENGSFVDRLHALDIATGAEKFGGPVVIQASVPGTGSGSVSGTIAFNPEYQFLRSALLLQNGIVYMCSASMGGDQGPYHGWVLGYSASTLSQVGVFNTSPNARQGGIWGSGAGPAAAPGGTSIFVLTGNGAFDANTGGVDYGDSFLKLGTASGLSVLDYFTPYNQLTLDDNDVDLGAGSGMLLPKEATATPEIIGAGKEGTLYVINTNSMGKFQTTGNNIVQTLTGSTTPCAGGTGSPAYFNNAVYYSGCGDYVNMFSVSNGLLSTTPVSHSPEQYAVGSTPSISANGSTNGIVWSIAFYSKDSILHAYNASNLSQELYKAELPITHFAVPTIANGLVYVGTFSGLLVYGLL